MEGVIVLSRVSTFGMYIKSGVKLLKQFGKFKKAMITFFNSSFLPMDINMGGGSPPAPLAMPMAFLHLDWLVTVFPLVQQQASISLYFLTNYYKIQQNEFRVKL